MYYYTQKFGKVHLHENLFYSLSINYVLFYYN